MPIDLVALSRSTQDPEKTIPDHLSSPGKTLLAVLDSLPGGAFDFEPPRLDLTGFELPVDL